MLLTYHLLLCSASIIISHHSLRAFYSQGRIVAPIPAEGIRRSTTCSPTIIPSVIPHISPPGHHCHFIRIHSHKQGTSPRERKREKPRRLALPRYDPHLLGSLPLRLSVYLSTCLSVYLSVCLSVRLSALIFIISVTMTISILIPVYTPMPISQSPLTAACPFQCQITLTNPTDPTDPTIPQRKAGRLAGWLRLAANLI